MRVGSRVRLRRREAEFNCNGDRVGVVTSYNQYSDTVTVRVDNLDYFYDSYELAVIPNRRRKQPPLWWRVNKSL